MTFVSLCFGFLSDSGNLICVICVIYLYIDQWFGEWIRTKDNASVMVRMHFIDVSFELVQVRTTETNFPDMNN